VRSSLDWLPVFTLLSAQVAQNNAHINAQQPRANKEIKCLHLTFFASLDGSTVNRLLGQICAPQRALAASYLGGVCWEKSDLLIQDPTSQARSCQKMRALCSVLVLPFAGAHFLGYGAARLRAFRGHGNLVQHRHHLLSSAAIDPSVVERRFTAAVIDNFAPIEQQWYWTGAGKSSTGNQFVASIALKLAMA
jgi:hypothetical protein